MTPLVALLALVAQPQSPAPAAPASPETPSDAPAPPLVRRGVNTAPRVSLGDITIRNSGSTNSQGYTIVVHPGGDADVTVNGETVPKMLPAAQTKWLFAKVAAATPLDALPGEGCMKSVSFGTSTTVSYGGTTSPDVSCGGDDVLREISRTVGVVVKELDVRPGRPVRREPP